MCLQFDMPTQFLDAVFLERRARRPSIVGGTAARGLIDLNECCVSDEPSLGCGFDFKALEGCRGLWV